MISSSVLVVKILFTIAVVFNYRMENIVDAFRTTPILRAASRSSRATLSATWQQELDELLDIDTPLDSKREKTRALIGRTREITNDVFSALRERDLNKVAPRDLQYGKALIGLQDFREQLVSDIIPEVLTKGVPKLVDEGPMIARRVVAGGPAGVMSKGRKAVERLRELSQDQDKRQAKKDEIRREIRNILKSDPEGLYSPDYELLQEREYYELRKYSGYSVCTKSMISDDDVVGGFEMDPISVSSSFMTLADYIFGNNTMKSSVDTAAEINQTEEAVAVSVSTEIGMTTPVIIDESSMSFVLPKQYNAANAPTPVDPEISIQDVDGQVIAARKFTGIATENEVAKQRAKLEDALIADNIMYDAMTFKVLTYNPPLTLPWVRRNEVCFVITTKEEDLPKPPPGSVATASAEGNAFIDATVEDPSVVEPVEGSAVDDEEEFFTAPEAGD